MSMPYNFLRLNSLDIRVSTILPLIIWFIALLSLTSCTSGPNRVETLKHKKAIMESRQDKDRFFKTSPDSPLLNEQQWQFKELSYYPVDITYRVTAHYQRLVEPREFRIQTSTGHERVYVAIAQLDCTVSGKATTLFAYQEKGQDPRANNILFIPFMDRTNGLETYPGGRYLEVGEPTGDSVVLDFNLAYNPYCAYNYNFSCPIPPPENHINLEIKAGEKLFPLGQLQ
ncbi:MAG: DUF1684 domain-containing protein [Proteobacteria bacterium]|nr:DUF1684 domain-containing protein [Desulfobulbaceae bacterium]MBU4152274.1 DUF1684 domain-containing protein [Pseudomonadota bacterium]